MNIVLTVNYSPWSAYSGGGQRSTHNLAVALSHRGHDVTVVYTKPPWETVDVPADLPYRVRWAAFYGLWSRRKAPLRPLNAFSVASVVREIVEEADGPVVVQCNGEEGARLPSLRATLPFGLVATPRYSEYPAGLTDPSAGALKQLVVAITQTKFVTQGMVAKGADRTVPPSAYAARMLRQAYDLPPERLAVIHNGVPREFLTYDHDPDAVNDGPVAFFGRFAEHKGVDVLIEALGRLGSDAPQALLIGRGEQEAALRDQVERLGLSDRVSFRPWMTHDELGRTLTDAKMVVLPSRQENFSLAILSALAVGVPTISTRIGGTPEIIDDGDTGLLVSSDDPADLADAIRRLQDNPDTARRLGAAGRAHVREHLTWEVAAARFEELFETVLHERGLATPSQTA